MGARCVSGRYLIECQHTTRLKIIFMKQRRTSNQSSSTRAARVITHNLRLLLGVLLLPLYTAHAESFRFALLGDVPGISTDKGSAAMLAGRINKQPMAFSIFLGDPRFEDDRSGIKNRAGSGYAALRFDLAYILTETRHRDMSVVVMHAGPSHKLIVDQPLVRRNPQYPTANLHRIQVPGGRPAGWLRVIVEQDVPLKFRVEEAQ